MSFDSDFITWLGKPAKRCLLAEVRVKSGGIETTRYLSTVGYNEPGNSVDPKPWHGRISGGVQFTRRLDLSGTGGSISFGDIELDNSDGSLDGWLSDIWAARSINLYLGDKDWSRSQFRLIFSGTVDDIVPKDRKHLSLTLRDVFGPLNSTLSTATVGGSGDNKDALRPICLGECFNVSPVLVDSATQKYAVHLDDHIERVIEVRDNGLSVSYTADLTHGTFTLTNARFAQITCDVQGALDVGSPAVFATDVGGLVHLVAAQLGDGNFLTDSQIDLTALATFRAANTQPVGLYLSERVDRLPVMQRLAAAIGATVTTSYAGQLILVKIGFGTPVGTIGMKQMVDGTFQPIGRPPIQGAIRIDGEQNWTPQAASSISGAVTIAQIPMFEDEYVTLADSDVTVIAEYFQSTTPEATQSLMVVEADISDEVTRRLDLWKTPRTIFGFDAYPECLQYEIGDTITLTHDRFGLSAGVTAQVVGVLTDLVNSRVHLEVLV